MILLVSAAGKASECANALQQATEKVVETSGSLREAAVVLQEREYELVVIEQSLVESEPTECDLLLQHLNSAMPVFVNFAISGIERVTREVKAASLRRKRETIMARQGAEEQLRNELKGNLTALMLSCELALQVSGLPEAAQAKLQNMDELARGMKQKLEA